MRSSLFLNALPVKLKKNYNNNENETKSKIVKNMRWFFWQLISRHDDWYSGLASTSHLHTIYSMYRLFLLLHRCYHKHKIQTKISCLNELEMGCSKKWHKTHFANYIPNTCSFQTLIHFTVIGCLSHFQFNRL